MSIAVPIAGQVISASTFGSPVVNALNAITDGTNVVTAAGTFTGNVSIAGNLSVTGVGQHIIARKTADETVNNSSAFQNDDVLLASVVANAVYLARLHIMYNSGTTPDFKYQFTVPAGTTLPAWSFIGTTGAAVSFNAASSGGVSGLGGTGADQPVDSWGVIITSGTAGTVQVQWAQDVANASNTIVRAGSYLELIRIA